MTLEQNPETKNHSPQLKDSESKKVKTSLVMSIVALIVSGLAIVLGVITLLRITTITTNFPGAPGGMDGGGQPPNQMMGAGGPNGSRSQITAETENTTVASSELEIDDSQKIVIDLSKQTNASGANFKNGNLYLTQAGVYELSGDLSGSVEISADVSKQIVLELAGVNIKSSTQAAIVNQSTAQLVVVLMTGTRNTLEDGGSSDYDAALFSNGALVIQGQGELVANGKVEEGIATQDADLTIHSGIITVTAVDDGINAGGDEGGVMSLNGGTIYINAGGDGLDSNSDLIINGGEIFVIGSTQADNAGLDADGLFQINGGKLIALGSGMLETADANSRQKSVAFNLKSAQKSGSYTVVNEAGLELTAFTAPKTFSTLIFSSSEIVSGTSYSLYNGSNLVGTQTAN